MISVSLKYCPGSDPGAHLNLKKGNKEDVFTA